MKMGSFNIHLLMVVLGTHYLFTSADTQNDLLQQDPKLWPGHLEPFGSKQKTVEVASLDYWPEPSVFFENYVEKNIPVAFKGLAKKSPAYKLFTDEFLRDFPGSDSVMITAEPNKKEIRNSAPKSMSFKEYIQRYHNESLYMVNSLPEPLRKYVLMPAPLRCEDTKELLDSQVTWFSSGGTKSVLHNDDVDNINCLYRGSKELLFIEYNKNKKFVPIDRPEGGYSSINVDSVDYTKYPMFRHVDQYHHVTMEEGDCVFIPYHWYHQVNSFANDNGQNLAINIWFKHVFNHRPVKCDLSTEEATLDKYNFPDNDDKSEESDDEDDDGDNETKDHVFPTPTFGFLEDVLNRSKKKKLSLQLFSKIILKGSLNPQQVAVDIDELQEDVSESLKKLFVGVDVNEDGKIDHGDLEIIKAKEDLQDLEILINRETAVIEDYFEDLVEDMNQERRRKKEEQTKDEL